MWHTHCVAAEQEDMVNNSNLRLLAFASVLAACPVLASAQSATEDTGRGPSHRFGHEGQLAISSDAALSIEHATPTDVTTITLQPAADYFVMENFSVGGFIGFDYVTAGDSDATTFSIGPRVGYNITLSDLVSIWPKLGLSYAHSSRTDSRTVDDDDGEETTVENTVDNDALQLNLFAPFVFHPATHFFAGFGPFLDVDLTGDDKVTTFGMKLTLGGWLD
jgi:hypothetical protein